MVLAVVISLTALLLKLIKNHHRIRRIRNCRRLRLEHLNEMMLMPVQQANKLRFIFQFISCVSNNV